MHVILDFFLHLDAHLEVFVSQHGPWVYGLLFLIVFCETGLVVTPFLPGDSLLFTVGALAATGILDPWVVVPLLPAAAILGNSVNYSIGHFIGPRVFRADDRASFWHRLLNRRHLNRAHQFFERHGGAAVVLGQFMPFVRTFVPFVAGCGSMSYRKFALYNVTAAWLWFGVCAGAGYAFGSLPQIKQHFELVIVSIVCVSLLPVVFGYLSRRIGRKRAEPIAAD